MKAVLVDAITDYQQIEQGLVACHMHRDEIRARFPITTYLLITTLAISPVLKPEIVSPSIGFINQFTYKRQNSFLYGRTRLKPSQNLLAV